MRLIVMGQKAFGRDCLEQILDAGQDEVVAVYCAPEEAGKKADPLKEFALSKGLPVHQPANFNEEPTVETLRSHDADLMVMAYTTMFAPKTARNIPRLGSICFHPSLLPRHRGPSAVNWAIIWGENRSGFSWFYPTDGLDEGDLALQWECEIGPDDTVIDLYFKKIFPAGVESVLQVCDLFRSGNPPRVAQDEATATYEGWCRKRDSIGCLKQLKLICFLKLKKHVIPSVIRTRSARPLWKVQAGRHNAFALAQNIAPMTVHFPCTRRAEIHLFTWATV